MREEDIKTRYNDTLMEEQYLWMGYHNQMTQNKVDEHTLIENKESCKIMS